MQSNTSKSHKEKLLENLKDKEYRKAFVESHINNGVAFQIRTMRGDLTQEDLGKLAGMKQTQICRLENPNYGSFTLKTLKEIAAAFDVALIVRFVPFSELVKWDLNLSAQTLLVESFDKDPYFQEKTEDKLIVHNGWKSSSQSFSYEEKAQIDKSEKGGSGFFLQKCSPEQNKTETPALKLSMKRQLSTNLRQAMGG